MSEIAHAVAPWAVRVFMIASSALAAPTRYSSATLIPKIQEKVLATREGLGRETAKQYAVRQENRANVSIREQQREFGDVLA